MRRETNFKKILNANNFTPGAGSVFGAGADRKPIVLRKEIREFNVADQSPHEKSIFVHCLNGTGYRYGTIFTQFHLCLFYKKLARFFTPKNKIRIKKNIPTELQYFMFSKYKADCESAKTV